MADYSYLKRQVEREEKDKLEKAEQDYFAGESECADLFAEFVRKQVKDAVMEYYRYGKARYITKKVLSREYTFFRDGVKDRADKYEVICAAVVKSDFIGRIIERYPEIDISEKDRYKIFFPSKRCMDSFEKTVNEKLNGEQISVYFMNCYNQMSSLISNDIYFINIRAELGKL